jgi:hypothetical protein
MKNPNRNLLVLIRNEFMSEQAIEEQVHYLNCILTQTESLQKFCEAHELVDRNKITTNRNKIIKETQRSALRAFRFLINRN